MGEFTPMYRVQPVATSATFTITAPKRISWASAEVSVFDAFGNEYHHRVDGTNHR